MPTIDPVSKYKKKDLKIIRFVAWPIVSIATINDKPCHKSGRIVSNSDSSLILGHFCKTKDFFCFWIVSQIADIRIRTKRI